MYDGDNAAWQAELQLRFRRTGDRSTFESRHRGPLRIQKALYPEGEAVCHAVVLHPPGGIAGGDSLTLDARVDRGAHAVITTPGAARWYKSNGRSSSQQIALDVDGDLEWLPQESIVFDQAQADSRIDILVRDGGRMIGWDIVVLGRRAAGEHFARGTFAQTIRLTVGDELVWVERTRLVGGDPLLASPIGLAGHHVTGCLWGVGVTIDEETLDAIAARLEDSGLQAPATRIAPSTVIARALDHSVERVRNAFEIVWGVLRPRFFERDSVRPRLWAT